MVDQLLIVLLFFYGYWILLYLNRWFKIKKLINKFSKYVKAQTNQELKPLISLMPQVKKFHISQEISHGASFETNRFNAHSIYTLLLDKEPYTKDKLFTSLNPFYPLKMIFWLPSRFLKASGWVLKDGTAILINCILAPLITLIVTTLVDLLTDDVKHVILELWRQLFP